MIEYLKTDVEQWLTRSLEAYYPVVFIDAIHIKVYHERSVENEAFYVVMAVKEDKTREVLGIFIRPSEIAKGWEEMFRALQERGVEKIGLTVADGIKYLENALAKIFPGIFLPSIGTLNRQAPSGDNTFFVVVTLAAGLYVSEHLSLGVSLDFSHALNLRTKLTPGKMGFVGRIP